MDHYSRQVCEINAQSKAEAIMALEMLKAKIMDMPYMEPVHEKVIVTNEGTI